MVFGCKIPPNYFLDEMTIYEVEALLEEYNNTYQDSWEQTRWIGYILALSNGGKIKKPSDLMKFSWEEQISNNNTVISDTISKEEYFKLKECMIKSLKNKKDGEYTIFNPL